jgi:hypothetical protein
MRLLRNPDIKDLLRDYYGYAANQRQFEEIRFRWRCRHLELAAGILSHEQETYICISTPPRRKSCQDMLLVAAQ